METAVIVDLPDTSSTEVSKKLITMRDDSGAMALGRVMTLIVVTDEAGADDALTAARSATRRHPSRIVAIVTGDRRSKSRMDARLELGGEVGVSEIVQLKLTGELANHGAAVVIPLLAADTPVVAWWPGAAEDVASSPIGALAGRRITDSSKARNPRKALQRRAADYAAGDTDMAWSRSTRWRGLLATALDLPPYEPVTSVTVTGAGDSASTDLVAGWLAARLKCPVKRARSKNDTGLVSVRMERASGPIDLVRPDKRFATLTQPGQPMRRLDLTRPDTAQSLAEELARLGEDEIYREALVKGLPLVTDAGASAAKLVQQGKAPSPRKAAAKAAAKKAAATRTAKQATGATTTATTKKATSKKATSKKATKRAPRKAATR